MEKKRSVIVTVLGLIYIVEAFIAVIPSLFIIPSINLKGYSTIPPLVSLVTIIIEMILAIVGLIGGIGLLKLFNWARKLLIIVAAGSILALLSTPIVASIMAFGKGPTLSSLLVVMKERFALLFFIGTIFYLSNTKVKEQFR